MLHLVTWHMMTSHIILFPVYKVLFHCRVDGSGEDSHLNGEEHDESREGKVMHVVLALGCSICARMQVLPGSILLLYKGWRHQLLCIFADHCIRPGISVKCSFLSIYIATAT